MAAVFALAVAPYREMGLLGEESQQFEQPLRAGRNVLRVKGELNAADVAIGKAKQLWQSGSDPDGLLDPGRLLDLEGSLRRAQRRFEEALGCFDRAIPVSRFSGRVLMNKATTYDVLGQHELAIAALQEAVPHVERRGDARLRNILRLNLASNLVHASRHGEAAELVEEVRRNPEGLGKIDIARIPWLEGRIQAGLGRRDEALRLLARARESFAAEEMFYDVALALLEEPGSSSKRTGRRRSRSSPASCPRCSPPRACTARPSRR